METIKDAFVKGAIKELRREGFKQSTLEWILRACWEHGASAAFYIPHLAYESLEDAGRQSFAAAISEDRFSYYYKKETGRKPSRQLVDAIVKETFRLDEAQFPVTRLSPELGWLVGRRSMN